MNCLLKNRVPLTLCTGIGATLSVAAVVAVPYMTGKGISKVLDRYDDEIMRLATHKYAKHALIGLFGSLAVFNGYLAVKSLRLVPRLSKGVTCCSRMKFGFASGYMLFGSVGMCVASSAASVYIYRH